MGDTPVVQVGQATAAEICARFTLSKEARALIREGMGPGPFIEALFADKQYIAGIEFLAHALPPREAVWWGCLCLQHACGKDMSSPDNAAARAAVEWVLQPSDNTRVGAKAQGEAAGRASIAGALAIAAYQTGPVFAVPGGPTAPVPPFAAAKSIANAVKLACTKSGPLRVIETQKSFVELGLGVANGRFA